MPENADFRQSPKVVRLDKAGQNVTRARLARLPAPVHALREKAQLLLARRLKGFFDRADDSLFEMADKAHSNQEQNLFFDSMREVRVQRRGIERRFAQVIDEAFADLLATTQDDAGARGSEDFAADALSLVDHEDLEEMVALDSAIARANNDCGEAIQFISLRMDSLVPMKVYQRNNPVGPDVIARAFMDQVKKLDIDIKAKLVLFKLFDKAVIAGLSDIYKSLNELLVDHNVLPSLSRGDAKQAKTSGGDSPTAQQSAATEASAPGVSTVQGGQPAAPQSGSDQGQLSPEVVSALQNLFGSGPESSAQGGAASGNLLNVLSLAQRLPTPSTASASGVNVRALITDIQRRQGVDTDIARLDDEVINLVNMLFDFILEDRNLALPMKALISRMQIPVVKVALLDREFFTKGGHAARRLLNEMSKAALGWQGDVESGRKDPLYRKMDEIVRRMLNEFDTDVSLFSELLADFTSFIEKEKKRSAVLERRTLDAEDGKAKAEVARTVVALEVELRTIHRQLPKIVPELVNKVWSNVLFVTALKHGYRSEAWESALVTLEDLVWSVQLPQSDEDRKALIRLVPDLLKRLRAGFDTISYNPYEMSTQFKALEDVHLSCIRGKAVERVEAVPVASPAKGTPRPATGTSQKPAEPSPAPEQAETQARTAADAPDQRQPEPAAIPEPTRDTVKADSETLPEDDPQMRQVGNFVQGAWFEMADDKDSLNRCRLAAFIKPTGKYIFVNRNGMKVAEKTREELARLLKEDRLRPLDNSVLFDRALETVVSSLRKNRP